MTKPPSIARFEIFYWASFVLGLVISWLSWSQTTQQMATNPVLAQNAWVMPAVLVVSIAIRVLLWYFVAKRPSVVAKWIIVVFAAIGVIGAVTSLATLFVPNAPILAIVLTLVSEALYIAAAVMLFKPDALAWFGETPREGDPRI